MAVFIAEVNTVPTPAQVKAGNYKKGHVTIGEFDITIENPAGSVRRGVDASGNAWETHMANAYGYIKGTESVDGDHIDVFLAEDMDWWNARRVFVIDQTKEDGTFDEHKVMLGFNDGYDAMQAYLANYDPTWQQKHPGLRISEVNIEDFNKWIHSSKRKTKPFAEYKRVTPIDGEAKFDNQGNPIDENCNLIVEKVESVSAITDKDFSEPYRTVGLPTVPDNVSTAIGTNGRDIIIKKSIFVKNRDTHKELTPDDSREILNLTLYNPNLVGANQPIKRPDYKVAIHIGEKNAVVVLDVYAGKDNVEIVGWRKIDAKGLERIKRQATREGGQFLILSPDDGSAAALSALPSDVSSDGKVNTLLSDKQESGTESSQGALSASPQQQTDKSDVAFGSHDNSKSYAITPATYTNKKGKETPMHRLEFGRELTKEEESAVKKFASEKQGEGRFAPARGWKDRENGGWLFRTEEDARKAGDLIGNEEAVADAQPLSREDIAKQMRDILGVDDSEVDDVHAESNGDKAKFRDGESDGERLLAIRGIEPIEVNGNHLDRKELFSIYRELPSVEKDGQDIRFLRTTFGKNYKEGGLFAQAVPVLDEVLRQSVLAYSDSDSYGGTLRVDGTEHKSHPNVTSFDNYVGKIRLDGQDYYVRLTVQNTKDSTTGVHSCFVSNVELYENATLTGTDSAIFDRPNQGQRGIMDAKLQQFFERASAELLPHDMRQRAIELSEKLHTPIRLVDSADEAMDNPSARHRRAKGWATDSGEIVVIVPNNVNVADMENTVVHEIVGHNGLRAFIGTDRFDEFLGVVYAHAGAKIKQEIDRRTAAMVDKEADRLTRQKGGGVFASAEARVEAEHKREQYRKEATEEYMADMAGRIGDHGFEQMSQEELTLWGKIKAKIQQFLDAFLRGLKIAKSIKLTDKDLAYILFKSWKYKRESGVFAKAEDMAMRRKTGYGESSLVAISEREKKMFRKEAVADKIEALFEEAVAGHLTGKPVEVGTLTAEGRAYLERLSGIKMKDKVSFVLNPSDLVHMYNDHFGNNEKDKGNNIPLTNADIRAIADVVSNPERVVFGVEPDGLQRKLFYFLSSAGEGAYNLLEIYGDRKGNLTTKTFYKTRKAVSQRVLSLVKSEHLTSVTDGASLSDGAKLPKFFEYPKSEDIGMRIKTGGDKTMFADGGNKKTGISEAGLNPIYPSEAGRESGNEARLNDLVPATNHAAKVIEKLEIAKAGLYQVAEAYRETNNPKRFLTDLSRSMDLIVGQGGSGYRSFELQDGRVMTIRVSNHNANSEYAKEPTVSVVVKRRQTPNTFRTYEKSEVHEYVYFRDELQKAPIGTLSSIAESISELLDTGEYIDRTGLARENHSPESRTIHFRDGDDIVAKRPVLARAMYERRVASSTFQMREAVQDSVLGLLEAYRAIDKASGNKRYIEDVPDYQNAYVAENLMTSRNRAEQTAYKKLVLMPMLDEVLPKSMILEVWKVINVLVNKGR